MPLIDGYETFIERAVMEGIKQESVIRRKPLRCWIRIAPRLDVALNEQLLVVLEKGISVVLLVDANPRHDGSVPALRPACNQVT